ncbi:MAG TPA: hypothetical protein PKN48_08930 [Bacteroidales bacterium]|nr:hypothetical protein [Bacteroidales bacterium]
MKRLINICAFSILALILCAANTNVSALTIKDDSVAQNREWSFGINCGAAFANKYHANFYNGAFGNQNEISLVFSNPNYLNEIRQVINDTFAIVGMPTAMRYKPAFCVGVYIKKNFNNHFGAFVQFNYSKFTAEDLFTMKIGATSPLQTRDSLVNYPIWGSEDRINIDIGASYEFPLDDKIFGFVELGFNLNNTKVRENKIAIENLEYSIINIYGDQQYIPNTNMQEYPVRQGGIGLGAFLSPGVKFRFSENIAIDLLGSIYWSKIKLMHYESFRLHYNVMLRFLFSSDFLKSY